MAKKGGAKMVKEKILKIKVGEFWDDSQKKSVPVFKTAFKKLSKDGLKYYETTEQIFINEVEKKEKTEVTKPSDIEL
jgi:Zn-dependent peptidase ImmA (M78 family)